jgi:two-component system, NarL family, nitrate/nitrite response regulator NarL
MDSSRRPRRSEDSRSVRVLIADDNPAFRNQLRLVLDGHDPFHVCGEARDAAAAVHLAAEESPDLCLVDVRMPGYGVAAAWEITARLPSCKVVMITVSDDDRDLFAALRAGACGYLLKDLSPKDVRAALVRMLDGEAAIDGRLVARMAETFRDHAPRRRDVLEHVRGKSLTSREWEVLDLLRHSSETADIAERLSLSQATVRSHVAAILRKLRAPDRETAIRMFEQAAVGLEPAGAEHNGR